VEQQTPDTAGPGREQKPEEPAVAARPPKEPVEEDTGCGSSSKEAKLPPLKPDPTQTGTPRYFCAEPEVKPEAVWAGKRLTFNFTVANKGTADLLVKLKGG